MTRGTLALIITVLTVFQLVGQQPNDACITATVLCPNTTYNGSNYQATATVCPNCEDDFTFCFSGTNSVWFRFTTNEDGGDVQFDFSNLVFNPQAGRGNQLQAAIIQATVICDAATYTLVSNCESTALGNFTLTAIGLAPNTDFFLVVNGAQNGGATLPAEATFDVIGSGPGFNRPTPSISMIGPSMPICPQNIATFNAYLTNCTDTSAFHWYVNNTLRGVTTTNFWQTSELQNGDVVSVSCTCFTLCPDTLTVTLPAVSVDPIQVSAGPDVTIQLGESTQLVGVSNADDFIWSPAQTLNTPYSITTFATPEETTIYTLTASNANCSLSDEVTVFVTDNLVIPGSFSPNGDGHNDLWIIQGIEFYPDTQLQIYDRWGQEIVNISGYSPTKAWDGTFNGKPVSDGVYFYSLNLKETPNSKPIKGSVTVIR